MVQNNPENPKKAREAQDVEAPPPARHTPLFGGRGMTKDLFARVMDIPLTYFQAVLETLTPQTLATPKKKGSSLPCSEHCRI